MRVCSFGLCYYNILENVKKDGARVDAYPCDGCGDAFYHSEFCLKLDKKHQRSCSRLLKPPPGQPSVAADKAKQAQQGARPLDKPGTAVLVASVGHRAAENKENVVPPALNIPQKNNSKLAAQPAPSWAGPKAAQPTAAPKSVLFPESAVASKKRGDVLYLSNYEVFLSRILGEGSYGKVLVGREILTALEVAVKVVSKQTPTFEQQAVLLQREVAIQRQLRHQNILGLKEVFEDADHVYLILEYCGGGSLFDYIQKKGGLSERETFVYFLQVCLAIETLHKNRMVHRDIKPENLLLDKGKNLKLCDFGCSFMFLPNTPKLRKTYCGTVDYMAPEFFLKNPHGPEADIWALGVLLFEMCHGRPPFDQDDESKKIQAIVMPGSRGVRSSSHLDSAQSESRIADYSFGYKSGVSGEFQDLVERLIRAEPKDRLNVEEIFNHPWIRLNSEKLNIDVDRCRGRGSVGGKRDALGNKKGPLSQQQSGGFTSPDVACFARCELRPTEVVLYGDESYLDELKQENEREKMLAQALQDPRSTYSQHPGLDRSGLLVAQYSYRDSETDSTPESPCSPSRLMNLLKDTNEDSLIQASNQLAPQTERVSVQGKKKGKPSHDVFKKKVDPHQESCQESTREEGFRQKPHERSPTECKLKSKAVWEGNRPTTKDCGQSPINRRVTSGQLEVVDLGSILLIEEAPRKEPSMQPSHEAVSMSPASQTVVTPQIPTHKPAAAPATQKPADQKAPSLDIQTIKVPSRSRSEISRRDKDSSRSSFGPTRTRDQSLQGAVKASARGSPGRVSTQHSGQTSAVGGFFGGFLNIFGCTSVQ